MKQILPLIRDGVGFCHDRCPSHDGKRCEILGHRAPDGQVCEPWAREMSENLKRLRNAIRWVRDQRGDDRCWKDLDRLYAMLPEGYTPPLRDTLVELENCKRYIASCHDPRVVYISPQRRIEELESENQQMRRLINRVVDASDGLDDIFDVARACFEWLRKEEDS